MPPESAELLGRETVLGFFSTVPTLQLVPSRANGQPALAAYLSGPDGRPVPFGLMVLTVTAEGIAVVTGFQDPAIVSAVRPD
jgi:RNA polymerase sigma-70 factor (ECF subfamily)